MVLFYLSTKYADHIYLGKSCTNKMCMFYVLLFHSPFDTCKTKTCLSHNMAIHPICGYWTNSSAQILLNYFPSHFLIRFTGDEAKKKKIAIHPSNWLVIMYFLETHVVVVSPTTVMHRIDISI